MGTYNSQGTDPWTLKLERLYTAVRVGQCPECSLSPTKVAPELDVLDLGRREAHIPGMGSKMIPGSAKASKAVAA